MANATGSLKDKGLFVGALASALYTRPTQSLIEATFDEAAPLCGPPWPGLPDMAEGSRLLDRWQHSFPLGHAEALDALVSDHFCLVEGIGAPLAPPWESLYFHDGERIFGSQTMHVRRLYASCGLVIEKKGNEPDDHIGLELSFAAYLLDRLGTAGGSGAGEQEHCLGALRSLVDGHLLLWVDRWSLLMAEHSRTEFYRALAFFVRGAVYGLHDDL